MNKESLRTLIREAFGEVMQEMARPNLKSVNKELQNLTSPGYRTQYFNSIPTQEIQVILNKFGLGVNQETREQVMDGIFTGRDGKMEEPVSIDQKGNTNALFVMTWHKMESGRYEIVAYVA